MPSFYKLNEKVVRHVLIQLVIHHTGQTASDITEMRSGQFIFLTVDTKLIAAHHSLTAFD